MKKPGRQTAKRVVKKVKPMVASTEKKKRSVKFPGGEDRERTQEELWFAQNLKTVRTHWGWDQKTMSEHLEMEQPSYSNIEHHRRSLKLNTISFISRKVKIPVHKMLVDPEEFTVIKNSVTPPKRPS